MPNNEELFKAAKGKLIALLYFIDSLDDNGVSVDHLRDLTKAVSSELDSMSGNNYLNK